MDDRVATGEMWEARAEIITVLSLSSGSQADLFMDLSMYLVGNPEAIVLAASFNFDPSSELHTAEVCVSLGVIEELLDAAVDRFESTRYDEPKSGTE